MTAVQTPTVTAGPEPADRLLEILNDGAITLLGSVGYRTGLFDTLAGLPWATSQQIADAAGLNERYVREWLGGVVTAGFVDYDPAASTYRLRRDYVPLLTGNGVDNLARQLALVGLLGEVQEKVVQAFRHGGGLTYADYPHFVEYQAADSGAVHDAALIDGILPLAGVVDRLREGADVLDVGCGAGHAINLMAQAFPRSRFTGYDFTEENIEVAREEAARLGLANARFEIRDVATIAAEAAYDVITSFDAIHDQAHPATVLANIRRALRRDGTYLMVDIKASSRLERNLGLPWASFLYAVSTFHCMSVSLAQGGEGLGTVWGTELAEAMLRDAGFRGVDVRELEDDPFNAYVVATP
jgi:2-polyprenyl-3-methyl-5-hydroxy-6-metoxy-1,4-benzoquinol methylase